MINVVDLFSLSTLKFLFLIVSTGQVHLNFEVKYYVENPSQLHDEQTRWLFFLQTWKKVVDGSLPTSPQTCCLLTSYYLQGILK